MTIRPAKREDKEQLLILQDELLSSVAKTKNQKPSHQPVQEVGSDLFDKTFDQDVVKYFVAEENGVIIGLATLIVYPLVRRGQYRAKLEELVVTEKMRRRGIGSLLLEKVLKYCKEKNITTMTLSSELELEEAHKFYKKHGGEFREKVFKFDITPTP